MKNIFVNQKSFDEKSGIILHFCKTLQSEVEQTFKQLYVLWTKSHCYSIPVLIPLTYTLVLLRHSFEADPNCY